MNIEKILVPVDFSECSVNALKYALELKKITKATIKIIHGYRIPLPPSEMAIDMDIVSYQEYKRNADDQMDLLRNTTPELEGVNYEYQLINGFAREVVLESVKDNNNLIVMGTKGISNRLDELLGSNTYHIIKNAKCPVLAVPTHCKFRSLKNVLFTADYKSIDIIERFDFLKSIISQFDSTLHILHIGETVKQPLLVDGMEPQHLNKYFNDVKHTFAFSGNPDVEAGINTWISKHNIDLLVMYPRKHNFLDRLFQKSITKKIAHHAALPLLTIHE